MLQGEASPSYGSLGEVPLAPRERVLLAATLIADFKCANPPPISSSSFTAEPSSYCYYYFRLNHASWRVLVRSLAVVFLFLSSFWETAPSAVDISVALSFLGGGILVADLLLRWRFLSLDPRSDQIARLALLALLSHLLEISLLLSLCPSVLSSASRIFSTSVFKPIIAIYVYPRARFALNTFAGAFLSTFKVVAVYLLVIFAYASCATALYSRDRQFASLGASFATLFELATSVNNPSCWMPLYRENKANAFFFVSFLLTSFFLVKNVLIAVSLNLYQQSERRLNRQQDDNRNAALVEAFKVLKASASASDVRRSDLLLSLLVVCPNHAFSDIERMYARSAAASNCLNEELVDYRSFHEIVPLFLQASVREQRDRPGPFPTSVSAFLSSCWEILKGCGGQLALLLGTTHVFVYLGMSMWRHTIPQSAAESSTNVDYDPASSSLYYLNNFDTYGEGLVTLFNVIVVNDWQQIANVYCEVSPKPRVYAFFGAANILLALLLANVLTAFFVDSFLKQTKNYDGRGKKANGQRRDEDNSFLKWDSGERT